MGNKFFKVSFDQFKRDMCNVLNVEIDSKMINDTINHAYKMVSFPTRATKGSAAYDIATPYTITIPPQSMVMFPTGLKACVAHGQFLAIVPRSSTGIKCHCVLANTIGVIDSDYFDNPKNEGHIFVALYNMSNETVVFEEGKNVVQGLFLDYHKTDDDVVTTKRNGGIGSTDEKKV
jgi:dUTP pyrophosphatase